MPNFKKYNYNQTAMVVIDFEEQLQPGTFEFTLHKLIDNHIDLSVFHEQYQNDTGGRSNKKRTPTQFDSSAIAQYVYPQPRNSPDKEFKDDAPPIHPD